MREIFAIESNCSTNSFTQAGERLHQFGLAVTLHSRNANNFASVHFKRNIVYMRTPISI